MSRVEKVLIATFFPRHVGGLQTHFDLLCKSLQRSGIKAIPVQRTSQKLSSCQKALLFFLSGFQKERAITRFLNQELGVFSSSLQHKIEETAPDIIHCHDAFSAFAARKIKLPLVLTVHGPLHLEHKMMGWKNERALQWLRSLEAAAYDRANAIIAVDNGQKEYILQNFKVDERKVRVIRNAVDVEQNLILAKAHCEFLEKIGSARFILVPRRLVPKNGVATAVGAMRFIQDRSLKLVIAGDGPEKKKLLEIVESYNLQDRVIFLGEVKQEKIFPLIKHALAVIVPSVPSEGVVEATSLSVLETMSLGKVVIASGIGGLKELIEDGVDGFLFEAGNEEMLARIIQHVLADEKLREHTGSNAQKKVFSSYTVSVWLQKILELYEQAYACFDQ